MSRLGCAVMVAALVGTASAALVRAPIGRRAAVAGAATALLGPTALPAALSAQVADSSWADHSGSFDFSSYKQSAALPGFAFKKLREGAGNRPVQFQNVMVHYVTYLPDGTRVESSYDGDGQPFAFRISAKGLGRGSRTANDERVITGFENVVLALQPGARVVVKIPPEAAYGATGSKDPPVPANSPLVCFLELVELGNIKGDRPRLGADKNMSPD